MVTRDLRIPWPRGVGKRNLLFRQRLRRLRGLRGHAVAGAATASPLRQTIGK